MKKNSAAQPQAVKVDNKAVFSLANKINGEKHIGMKAAYAEAKAQLIAQMTAPAAPVNTETPTSTKPGEVAGNAGISKEAFMKMLKKGSVKIVFINRNGNAEPTKGTLKADLITKRENVMGAKKSKNPEAVTFYDRLHGVWRSVTMDKLVSATI